MAFYAVDVRYRVIQRVTQGTRAMDNQPCFLIDAGSAQQAWPRS